MKKIAMSLALAAAAVFATQESAQAQFGPGSGFYGPNGVTPNPYPFGWSYTPYTYPYYGGGGAYLNYGMTLPGGGYYGYSYAQPGYYGTPYYGYSYPGYYYRPGSLTFFRN